MPPKSIFESEFAKSRGGRLRIACSVGGGSTFPFECERNDSASEASLRPSLIGNLQCDCRAVFQVPTTGLMLPNPDAELTAGFIGDVERSQINVDSLDGSSLVQEQRDLRFLAICEKQLALGKGKALTEIDRYVVRMIREAIQETD